MPSPSLSGFFSLCCLLPGIFSFHCLSKPLHFLCFLPDQRRECHSLLGEKKSASSFRSQILFLYAAVNSSPLDDALQLPPCCILSRNRIDALFYWKEMRAWKSCRFYILLNRLVSLGHIFVFSMNECAGRSMCDGAEKLHYSWSWIDAACMFS